MPFRGGRAAFVLFRGLRLSSLSLWESRAEGSERVPRPALPGPSARPSRFKRGRVMSSASRTTSAPDGEIASKLHDLSATEGGRRGTP